MRLGGRRIRIPSRWRHSQFIQSFVSRHGENVHQFASTEVRHAVLIRTGPLGANVLKARPSFSICAVKSSPTDNYTIYHSVKSGRRRRRSKEAKNNVATISILGLILGLIMQTSTTGMSIKGHLINVWNVTLYLLTFLPDVLKTWRKLDKTK